MSISKQAIGKTKKRALQKLKCKLTKEWACNIHNCVELIC
jgi:hypothetical protein